MPPTNKLPLGRLEKAKKLDKLYKAFSNRVKQLSLDSAISTAISNDSV